MPSAAVVIGALRAKYSIDNTDLKLKLIDAHFAMQHHGVSS